MSNKIVNFYKDKIVFLTGGTGFLGKIIIEKLFRACDVQQIFLLVRKKKGVTPYERVQNIFQEPIFNALKERDVDLTKKIQIIEGDLTKKQLGLSDVDIKTIVSKVNIIFHCGASLNMAANLTEATATNVQSTSELLDIISNVQNLEAFILVSTAFAFCPEECTKEKFYQPPISPELLIKFTTEMRHDVIERITKEFIFPWPNTYVYTKAVAESLLITKSKNLPVGLFRPVIVTSTAKEPIAGWSDNLYGPLGGLLAMDYGSLKFFSGDPNVILDTVPVDMVANALLCFAWDIHNKWKKSTSESEPPVLNFSGNRSSMYIRLQEYFNLAQKGAKLENSSYNFRIPLLVIKSRFIFSLCWFIFHTIFGFFSDTFCKLTGRKPKVRKFYKKLEKTNKALEYFTRNQLVVEDENTLALWNSLDESSKKTFDFDVSNLDSNLYFQNLIPGLKKYIVK